MDRIIKGAGVTASERKLAEIGEKTFLNLWSYPNTYIDKKQHEKGNGKEFCDLLVICGDDVIIFSDKNIGWPANADNIDIAWSRWYRRAIESSVNQIRGAARWIAQNPERVFLDAACTKRLPISFPPADRIRIHGVAVAMGANEACKRHFNDNVGTLVISSNLQGRDHTNPQHRSYLPFTVGDVDPSGPFVHVFDTISLDVLFHERDTITDFADYLTQRATLIRNGQLVVAYGEEDLIAHFMRFVGPNGKHGFTRGDGQLLRENDALAIEDGTYEHFIRADLYEAKRAADTVSYFWDDLISLFTKHIMEGTSYPLNGEMPLAERAEPGLRIMAKLNRVERRLLSQTFVDALKTAENLGQDRFTRTFLPGDAMDDKETGFVLLILGYPPFIDEQGGYERYREARAAFLQTYCLSVLYEYRHLKQVVGIGVDASSKLTGRQGGSEDLIAVANTEWTEEMAAEILDARKRLNIMVEKPKQVMRAQAQEYPDIRHREPAKQPLSRQQRRFMERQRRRRKPS